MEFSSLSIHSYFHFNNCNSYNEKNNYYSCE